MKQQLLLLQELQTIDVRLHEIRNAIQALPEKLKPVRQDLAKLEALLEQEKAKLAEAESWRREQEGMIKTEEEALRKAKSKLQASKSSKDFAAANRELENKRRSVSEHEEELLKVMEALGTTRAGIPSHENDVATLRGHLEQEGAEISAKVAELEGELAARGGGRDAIARKIDPQMLKRYEVVQRKRGVALVPVVRGMCTGCHMSLPPQLVNILARNESLEACPRCQRLIYRAELLAETAAPAAGEPKSE